MQRQLPLFALRLPDPRDTFYGGQCIAMDTHEPCAELLFECIQRFLDERLTCRVMNFEILCVGLEVVDLVDVDELYAAPVRREDMRPGSLITDGMFSLCRNPNYFGELLIYSSFCLLAMHWLPVALLALWVGTVWIPRMLKKDRSLSRYAGFAAYKQRTKLFIPHVI